MTEVKYSIYFTNHLGIKKKINIDNIVDIETSILEIENKKLYGTFTFITNGIYYKPEIIGDLKERIEFKYSINSGVTKSIKFVIDAIDYLPENNIKVYCKTKGIKYSYKYSGLYNGVIQAASIKELLDKLIDLPKFHKNLTDIPFYFDYDAQSKSIEEIIEDISKITDFDYYFKEGIIYFEDKKRIKKDDVVVYKFTEYKDILSFTTSANKDEKKINRIIFNKTHEEPIIATPSILLDIKDSPQCCSPDEVKIYTDDEGNTYKINPVNASFIVYYSPLINKPEINIPAQIGERVVVEKFELKNDEFVRLSGGIKELIAVEGVDNFIYKEGYNVLAFDFIEKGELKVTYNPEMNTGYFEHNGISEVTSVMMSATAIGEQTVDQIRIYPNPSHGIFNIEGIQEKVNIKIFNAFGEEILNNEMTLPEKIDLSTQADGVYFIRIFTSDGVHYEKLVIR